MKATILQEHLNKTLLRLGRIISQKTQLPIFQHVLIQAKERELQVAATSMDTTMISHTGAKIEKEGGLCVPLKLLSEFVATLPEEKVILEQRDDALFVLCDGYEATIPSVMKEEFPPLPSLGKKEHKGEKNVFLSAVESVLFSAATDEGRPVLTGVKFKKSQSGTTLASTDGYRLSVKTVSESFEGVNEVVVPARALGELIHVGREEKKESMLSIFLTNDKQLGFVLGDIEIYTRPIDGEYPSFEKIIPKNTTTKIVLEKELFMRAVKSAAIFARDSSNIIKLHIDKKEFVVSANTPQVGENKTTLAIDVDGDEGDIAFNSRFLLDFLNNYQEESFVFEMTGSLNPGVFKSPKDDSFLHIIMPVRVQNE